MLLSGSLLISGLAGHLNPAFCSQFQQSVNSAPKKLIETETQFEADLQDGWFLRLVLVADTAVRLRLNDPEGSAVVTSRLEPGVEAPVSIVARRAGRYQMLIRRGDDTVQETRYRFRAKEVREGRPDDQKLLSADRLMLKASAVDLRAQSKAFEAAIRDYGAALDLYKESNDREATVRALMRSGQLQLQAGDATRAVEILETAVTASLEIGQPELEASALVAVNQGRLMRGKSAEAAAASMRALQIAKDSGDRWLEADAMVCLGDASESTAQLERAIELYREAAALWRGLDWPRGEAEALLKLGAVHIDHGEEGEAGRLLTRSRDLWQALGDRSKTASSLQTLGLLYSKLDDKQKALDYYDRARSLLNPDVDREQQAALFSSMGWIYFDLGDMKAAADYFEQALTAAHSIGYSLAEALYLLQLGMVSFETGDYGKALEHYKASLSTTRKLGNLRFASAATLEIGRVYLVEGRTEEALELLNGALGSIREHTDSYIEARCLETIGLAHHQGKDFEAALEAYQKSLLLLKAGNYRYQEARTRLQLARLLRDRGNLEQARQQFEDAIKVLESVRLDAPGPELRASYFSSMHQYFEFYTDLLMRLDAARPGQSLAAEAFQTSERGRARSLLDSLAEAKVEIREGVDPDVLEREAAVQRRLNSAAERQGHLPGDDKAQLVLAAREITKLNTEYEQVRALIRSRSPRYASLTQPEPLTLRKVQHELLDRDTVLLEYALGQENSYLWVVSEGSYDTFRLPPRAEIEKSALLLRDLLTSEEIRPKETTRERRLRIQGARTRYWKEAAALSNTLLGPVISKLENKRLLIVSDGALELVPFAALPIPNRPSNDPKPLIAEHELVRLPSASTLLALRDEASERKWADKWLAVLADPVFDAQDIRLSKRPATRGDDSIGANHYPRLPATRLEAEAIAALAPAGGAMTAIGLDANLGLATSEELRKYRFVHFATHSIVNHEHPGLSGVALSMFDGKGKPRAGFLRLHDIYNLRLPVELVVLSACDSYLGKEVRGEGLMGIVRGFMYAGASRVMASLWKVDDLATKELMVRFYRNVFVEHQSPAAALRSAQVDMWQNSEWRSPYYWAAFVLQGEWR